ncbi:MAG: DUF3784 domain-containing protein [Tenuifilaceae bacterium]|jgi:hypothetical protein|nr:DUF3784 domain-containing protein [Tenuifilaceae bacterium]
MDTYIIVIAIMLVLLGFLVKSFPMLIAGYNTMSHKERAQVDIRGLSSFMRNVFVIMGLTILAGTLLFERLGVSMVAHAILPLAIVGGVIILLISGQRFNHNASSTLSGLRLGIGITAGATIAIVVSIIVWGLIPFRVDVNTHNLKIRGMYGVELYYQGMQSVDLTEKLPIPLLRTNGFSLGGINKGYFRLDGEGEGRLYLMSPNPPFIQITDHKNRRVIINFKDSEETTRLYHQLLDILQKQNRP